MKTRRLFVLIVISATAHIIANALQAIPVDTLLKNLSHMPTLHGAAMMRVSMPQLSNDVNVFINWVQKPEPTDSIMGISYLLEWRDRNAANTPVKGFSAYYCGNHFRYNGQRLTEYHIAENPIEFTPFGKGSANKGVHATAQFVSLLPYGLLSTIKEALKNEENEITLTQDSALSTYLLTITRRQGRAPISCTEYTLRYPDMAPLAMHANNNPGTPSEQEINVAYRYDTASEPLSDISEINLSKRYPQVFASQRTSTYRIDNLTGTPLPGFSLPTPTGERYMRQPGDHMAYPTLIIIAESSIATNRSTVESIRQAMTLLPFCAQCIWVFTDNDIDAIEEILTPMLPRETIVMQGSKLARQTGAVEYPSFIMVGTDGVVKATHVGVNNTLAEDVVEKMNNTK